MPNLKNKLIRLGHQNPELRKHLTPILDSVTKNANTFDGMNFEEAEEAMNGIKQKIGSQILSIFKSLWMKDIELSDSHPSQAGGYGVYKVKDGKASFTTYPISFTASGRTMKHGTHQGVTVGLFQYKSDDPITFVVAITNNFPYYMDKHNKGHWTKKYKFSTAREVGQFIQSDLEDILEKTEKFAFTKFDGWIKNL